MIRGDWAGGININVLITMEAPDSREIPFDVLGLHNLTRILLSLQIAILLSSQSQSQSQTSPFESCLFKIRLAAL